MRSVRCDSCGTKALMAASQCPKCGHLFEVRDGFGELLPLAYCSACDSYYPESLGSCKWCGTQPERPPIGPYILKGVGVAAVVVSLGVVWLTRNTRPDDAARPRKTAIHKPDSTSRLADTVASGVATASGEFVAPSATSDSTVGVRRDDVRTPDTLNVASTAAMAPIEPIPTRVTSRVAAPPTPLYAPSAKPPANASPKSRASSRWVNSISTQWVVGRAEASKGGRIVASIGPGSHVQLGESRGSWRRIKARGLAGWVEPGSFVVATRPPRKTGGLAAR